MLTRDFKIVLAIYWMMFAAVAVGLSVVTGDPEIGGFILTVIVVCPLAIIGAAFALGLLHEAAHAAVGKLVGYDVVGIVLGRGPRLREFRVGSMFLDVHRSLIGGVTVAIPRGGRARAAAFLLAGVAAEASIIAIASRWQPDSLIPFILRTTLIAVALFDIVLNLWPWTPNTGAVQTVGSDGKQLFRLLGTTSVPPEDVDRDELVRRVRMVQAASSGDFDRAVQLAENVVAEDPGDNAARAELGAVLILGRRWQDGLDTLRPLTDADDCDPMTYNNAAFAALMTWETDLLADADRWSEHAMLALPTSPIVADTRGAALVRTGRPTEGLSYLKLALTGRLSPDQRAVVVGFVSLAHHALGELRSASKRLAEMKRLDATCPLIGHVEQLMGSSSPVDELT